MTASGAGPADDRLDRAGLVGHGPLLVALDIDGTVMTYDERISDDVREAVAAVRATGAHVVLATGRSLHATVPVAHELGITEGWAVASNGSVTARLDPAEAGGYRVTDLITFDPGPALRLMHAAMPDALFAVEEVGVGFRMSAPFPPGELTGVHAVVSIDELSEHHVTRLVVRSPGHTTEEFHRLVHRMGLEDVTYAIGWTAWMDVAPHGVTKASALEHVRRDLDVQPSRTVAVGDGNNDLAMLEWAALGVAMGHAPEPVRAVADEVTGTIDDDGLLDVLRRLVP
ncbi:HAD family hydrolase [Cellulomonas sp. ATA003]|uniref:HAD family hydrolase n=1 Tax=Cellulomonas sp. ATA003 TaxID=3073064 RepID=UPI0028733FED|nr:HAD family hydrolase [Cellulomonas sp. ATA003]WNB85500.1 HAD family hydrolase [Cellulomonas sp. ATA003]